MKKIEHARIYVGTYHKYNSGSTYGEWFDLIDFTSLNDFFEACAELHKDENDPEYMFQDYENVPEGLIGESWLSTNYFDLQEAIKDLDEIEEDAFYSWCNNGHYNFASSDPFELLSSFEEDYIGEYESEEDFGREYVEEHYELSDFILLYFDYDAFTRDLFTGSYWSDGSHIFANS